MSNWALIIYCGVITYLTRFSMIALIKKEMLKQNEIQWLNDYHLVVYKNLKKYMSKSELNYLKDSCSNI